MTEKVKYKPPKSNLTPDEWNAIKSLRADESLIIIPADKGNKTVILNKKDYLDKLWNRIQHHTQLDHDPTSKLERNLNSIIDTISKSSPPPQQKPSPPDPELILPRSSLHKYKAKFSQPPWLHGLMKQKDDNPLREISDA